jgi:hypothetical protein
MDLGEGALDESALRATASLSVLQRSSLTTITGLRCRLLDGWCFRRRLEDRCCPH